MNSVSSKRVDVSGFIDVQWWNWEDTPTNATCRCWWCRCAVFLARLNFGFELELNKINKRVEWFTKLMSRMDAYSSDEKLCLCTSNTSCCVCVCCCSDFLLLVVHLVKFAPQNSIESVPTTGPVAPDKRLKSNALNAPLIVVNPVARPLSIVLHTWTTFEFGIHWNVDSHRALSQTQCRCHLTIEPSLSCSWTNPINVKRSFNNWVY
jgi:hypothetical protein